MRKKIHNRLILAKSESLEMPVAGLEDSSLPKPVPEKIVQQILERAVGLKRPESLGTANDVESVGYETLLPALVKTPVSWEQPRVLIGSHQCRQPYQASLLNCSALSFGPMGKPFILALNKAAAMGGFYQNSGEAGLSPYHFGIDLDVESPDFNTDVFFQQLIDGHYPELKQAGDIVWQLGNGYFGCRKNDGSFDPEQFAKKVSVSSIKMIEVKLSQGVEPRKEMPVKQVTAGIAKIMGIKWSTQACLQSEHSSFSSPIELLKFISQLRELSGGKPVGLKIGISHRHYFLAICKAMIKTGIMIDFISVDGMEAGTAASIQGAAGFTGTALNDAILFVHNALVGTNLRNQVKIIASGKVLTERDMVSKLARGADVCATARGILLAAGCDQQRECYKGTCQKGIATQDPELLKHFNVRENTQRIYQYHKATIQEMMELLSIAGVSHPDQIGPFHIQMRLSPAELKTLDEIYEFIKPGSLLSPFPWMVPESFRKAWNLAEAEASFMSLLEKQIRLNTR
jgi:glutamate synthase domain-containing protein 2